MKGEEVKNMCDTCGCGKKDEEEKKPAEGETPEGEEGDKGETTE